MALWECGMKGCGNRYESVEETIVHQTNDHSRHECKVCGTIVPDGYFAIRHAFDEHTRAEYVRAYGADSESVRRRERIKRDVEAEADLENVVTRLQDVGQL
ncbi:MAG: DUF7565 family protein [Halobacteriota archaeon]